MSEHTPSRDPFDLCGATIQDKYRITSVVGSGGFGVVYRGVHTGFGEPIAVKCLKLPSELEPEAQDKLLTRLQDEGRVLHRLSRLSSGIVQALDVGAITTPKGQWVPYLVLEWLEGQTLAELAKERAAQGKRGMELDEVIELLEPAARALAVAHQQKVAHRDVKPENLVLTEVTGQRTLKVLDFGIAKVIAHHSEFTAAPAATQKVATAFTPHYGAPEQFNKKRGATGPWTDVFALALIVVELVSGERALDGDDATQLYIAAADPAARPTLRYRGVETSNAVERVLQRALAVDPHDRYPDAGTFWDELREAAGQQPSPPSTEADQSETGEFVSRHGIGLEPEQLSQLDRALDARAEGKAHEAVPSPQPEPTGDTTARERAASEDDVVTLEASEPERASEAAAAMNRNVPSSSAPTDRHGSTPAGEAAVAAAGAAAADDGRRAAAASADASPADAKREPAARVPRTETKPSADAAPRPAEARGRARPPPPAEPADTVPPTSASERRSSWWMALVAIAALAGAGLLYAKLQQEQSDTLGGDRRRSTGVGPARAHATGRKASTLSAASLGGADAATGAGGAHGGADAAVAGAGGAGGGEQTVPQPPEDMVYIALPEGTPVPGVERGFFLDRTEVTTGAYRECITAGRCVPARRVVLTGDVASELWGTDPQDSDHSDLAPEKLAEAWGERCNDARGEVDHPINCVNHASATDYCQWRGRRLPTAAEWGYATQGSSGRRYPWGSQAPQCQDACFGLNGTCVTSSPQVATCAVGARGGDRTPEGVVDLGANVSEWVGDNVATAPHLQPRRKILGGSFTDEADALASAPTKTLPAVTAFVTIGFRCAMDVPAPEPAGEP